MGSLGKGGETVVLTPGPGEMQGALAFVVTQNLIDIKAKTTSTPCGAQGQGVRTTALI